MRILFLTQYFPPEIGAPQNRLWDLSRRMAARGHDVTVLTALPNYPKGEFYDGYRKRVAMMETIENIRIVRIWVYATKRKTFLHRTVNYLSFSILCVLAGAIIRGAVDVIYAESPPLFVGVAGLFLARLKRAIFALNISDLWPESAVVLGMLKNRSIINLATRLEETLYRRADFVTGQTEGIISSIRHRCPETATELLTNGVAPEFVEKVESYRMERARTRGQFGFDGKFVVVYAGIHGLAQGLETVLRTAQLLARYDEIQFVLVGDGPQKSQLQALAARDQQRNVQFLPPIASDQIPRLLSAIDVAVVPLKRSDLFKGALPSKMFEALGAGVPIVAALDGEAREVVESSGGGLVVEPENPHSMGEAILLLYRDPSLRAEMGNKARRFILDRYNRAAIAVRFEHLLIKTVV